MLEWFPAPKLLKIDVEGAEGHVLKGANHVLREHRPSLYIEVGVSQNATVTKILKDQNYRLYNGDSTDETEISSCAFNTLAVPEESSLTNAGLQ